MHFLEHTDGKSILTRLGLKILLGWGIFFALLFAMNLVRGNLSVGVGRIIGSAIGSIVGVAIVWVTIGPLIELANHHLWPALCLLETEIIVKAENSFRLRRYNYSEITSISQVQVERKKDTYCLTLSFSDNTDWATKPQGKEVIPIYTEISQFISQKSGRPIFPIFESQAANP
jgi:hypothetical protein